MDLKGLGGGLYTPLSSTDIETIHAAALHILETVGMGFDTGLEDLLDTLADAGVRVDAKQSRLLFPPALVMEYTAAAPARVVLYSRDGKNDLDLTRHQVYLGTGGAAISILDLDSGDVRPTQLADLYHLGRLVDRLDNIHFFLRPCIPTDIPETEYDNNVFFACFKATAKHVMAGVNDAAGLEKAVQMAARLAGGTDELVKRPFFSIVTSFAISPLKLCTQSTQIMQAAVRSGIPVALSAAPMSGSTAPMTMAGTLTQLHAEQLVGILICQLTRYGAPVLYGGIPGMANLNTMGYVGGSVECGMMNAAAHQLAHHVGVPNYNSAGLSDAKIPDTQAGWEKALTTVLAVMGGGNYVHHAAGMLASMLTVAYEQYVIDDEIIGQCLKVLKGITVDAEHIAADVIAAVGPGGNYITTDHTLKHMRGEYFRGRGLTDQSIRNQWELMGAKDTRERAREMARAILSSATETYIPPDTEAAMRREFNISDCLPG